jgi:hypothetical protein
VCIRDSGTKLDSFSIDKCIRHMFYDTARDRLLTLADDLTLYQHRVPPDCRVDEVLKVWATEHFSDTHIIDR